MADVIIVLFDTDANDPGAPAILSIIWFSLATEAKAQVQAEACQVKTNATQTQAQKKEIFRFILCLLQGRLHN